MVNAEYGKVKLSLTLHFNEYNKFRLLLDGKEPMDFENTGKAINYVFETEVGNHILTFESISESYLILWFISLTRASAKRFSRIC